MALRLIKKFPTLSLLVSFFIIISIFASVPFLNDAGPVYYPFEEKENFKSLSLLNEESLKEIKFYKFLKYLSLFTHFQIRKFNKNVYADTKNLLKLICQSILTPRSPPSSDCSLI